MANITWDSEAYAKDFTFIPQHSLSLVNLLDVADGSTILDLGCGTGELTAVLHEKGYKYAASIVRLIKCN